MYLPRIISSLRFINSFNYNFVCVTVKFFFLDLKQPILHVTPSETVNEMDSFILTCDVDGTPPIQYKWYKDNTIIDQAKSSGSLIMNKAMRLDSGNYRCVAINSAGLVKSKSMLMKINCK